METGELDLCLTVVKRANPHIRTDVAPTDDKLYTLVAPDRREQFSADELPSTCTEMVHSELGK